MKPRQNVKILWWRRRGGDPDKWHQGDGNVYTYEHHEYLPEGTEVMVDLRGYICKGEIVYHSHTYDGVCKPILKVLSAPVPVVVV